MTVKHKVLENASDGAGNGGETIERHWREVEQLTLKVLEKGNDIQAGNDDGDDVDSDDDKLSRYWKKKWKDARSTGSRFISWWD